MRLILLALLLSIVIVGPTAAEELYLLSDESGTLPAKGFTVVPIPGGSLLVAADGAPAPGVPGVEHLEAPRDWHLFLYRMDSRGDTAHGYEVLREKARILHDAGEGWLVIAAPSENIEALDAVHARKQVLFYVPLQPTVPDGGITVSQAHQAIKVELVNQLDLNAYSDYIRELAGDLAYLIDGTLTTNGNRYTYANSIWKTYDYFEDRFEAMGYTVRRQYFPLGQVTAQNIVAIKTGTVHPDSIIVVGGHLDAIAANLTLKNPAPGAEDNASGAAAVLHLAQIMANYRTESTVHFIGFGGEEQGLWGSKHYVQEAVANGDHIVASLTMDMIAAYETKFAVIVEGFPFADPLMSLMEYNTELYGGIPARKDYNAFGSDHVPFLQAGIPCFLAIDEDWNTYDDYHRNTDTFDKLTPELGLAVLKGVAATLADLSHPLPLSAEGPASFSGTLEFALRNEPNPFNPATIIRFELPRSSQVSLEILDLAGRRVRVLEKSVLDAGPHAIRWNGRDTAGRAVASGVYFYRLRAGGEQRTGRMALVR